MYLKLTGKLDYLNTCTESKKEFPIKRKFIEIPMEMCPTMWVRMLLAI